MEYEIGDDPQGLPDKSKAYRDGGLRDNHIFFRTDASVKTGSHHEDAFDEGSPLRQLGEAA